MPQASVQSSVSYLLASSLFWEVRWPITLAGVLFYSTKTFVCFEAVCNKEVDSTFLPLPSEEKVKILFY